MGSESRWLAHSASGGGLGDEGGVRLVKSLVSLLSSPAALSYPFPDATGHEEARTVLIQEALASGYWQSKRFESY